MGSKMSRLPSVVTLIANEEGRSKRTVQRWFKAGKYKGKGGYRTRGGHYRLRKPRRRQKENGKAYWIKDGHRLRGTREHWEQRKRSLVADVQRRLKVLVPQHNKARKLAWGLAGITTDLI